MRHTVLLQIGTLMYMLCIVIAISRSYEEAFNVSFLLGMISTPAILSLKHAKFHELLKPLQYASDHAVTIEYALSTMLIGGFLGGLLIEFSFHAYYTYVTEGGIIKLGGYIFASIVSFKLIMKFQGSLLYFLYQEILWLKERPWSRKR